MSHPPKSQNEGAYPEDVGPENGISAARCDRAIDTHVRRRRRAQESSRVCAILSVPNFRRLKFQDYLSKW